MIRSALTLCFKIWMVASGVWTGVVGWTLASQKPKCQAVDSSGIFCHLHLPPSFFLPRPSRLCVPVLQGFHWFHLPGLGACPPHTDSPVVFLPLVIPVPLWKEKALADNGGSGSCRANEGRRRRTNTGDKRNRKFTMGKGERETRQTCRTLVSMLAWQGIKHEDGPADQTKHAENNKAKRNGSKQYLLGRLRSVAEGNSSFSSS